MLTKRKRNVFADADGIKESAVLKDHRDLAAHFLHLALGEAGDILAGNHDAWLGAFYERTLGARFLPVGAAGREPGPATDRQTYGSFVSFDDPDGNGWIVQEITTRLPGRE